MKQMKQMKQISATNKTNKPDVMRRTVNTTNAMSGLVLMLLIALGVFGWRTANQPGRFPLKQILFNFNDIMHTDLTEAQTLLNLRRGVNLLWIDPGEIRERLRTLVWVRDVHVARLFPDTLSIVLEEKQVVGMGRRGDRLVLLDAYGAPIKKLESTDPVVLPVISFLDNTSDASRIVDFLNLLSRWPVIRNRVIEAVGVSTKRWILYTKTGIRLLLSDSPEKALKRLTALHERYRILDRNIVQVDLRHPGHIAVRPRLST